MLQYCALCLCAAYRLYTVVPRLVKFVDMLTNWYVRTNRRRLKVRRSTSGNINQSMQMMPFIPSLGFSELCSCYSRAHEIFLMFRQRTTLSAAETPFIVNSHPGCSKVLLVHKWLLMQLELVHVEARLPFPPFRGERLH